MKKLAVSILLCVVLPAIVSAQWKVETGINQGYEWNIFKNPDRIIENSDTLRRNRLWQNSAFNELTADIRYELDWRKSRLRLESDLGTNLYHQAAEAHKISYDLSASYRANFINGVYMELSPEYSSERQDGVEATDPVFSSRLSYRQIQLPLEIDFYLGHLSWLRLEAKYRNRVYDKRNQKQTSYSAYSFEALFKKSVDGKGWFNHEFEAENKTQYRDQATTDFFDDGAIEDVGYRQFTKIETQFLYRLQQRKEFFEIEFPVQGTLFYDHPSATLDYREIEVGSEVDIAFGRLELSLGVDRTLRKFNNFTVGDSNKRLYYTYWSGDAGIEIELVRDLFLKIEASYISRTSMRERLTTAFYREYTSSFIQSGIRVEL